MLILVACTPIATTWPERMEFPIREDEDQVPAPASPDTLRVMTWNIKYGAGRIDFFFDGWGDVVHMTEDEVMDNMDAVVALIEEQQPDVLLTQEVDVASKRSAYIDLAQVILEETNLNYSAFVPIWKSEYIAEEGLGPIEMGQAVLSRYPITRNTRVDLPQSEANSALVNAFWLHRAVQITEVDLGASGALTVINVHPEAYALDGTKQKHLAKIKEEAEAIDGRLVVGGDFNVIPPGSVNLDTFDDNADANTSGVTEVTYSEDEIASLDPFYDDYGSAIPLASYAEAPFPLDPDYDQSYGTTTCADRPQDQRRYFSHSLSKDVFWNQALDYLFTTEVWQDGAVLQCPGDGALPTAFEPMALSDHAPVQAVLVLGGAQ